MEREVCISLTVFTADQAELEKVVDAFKNVTMGMAMDGVRVGMSIYPVDEENEHDPSGND
jgi:hypothetical protein